MSSTESHFVFISWFSTLTKLRGNSVQADAKQTINEPVIRFQAAALPLPRAPSPLDDDDPLRKIESTVDLLLDPHDCHVSSRCQSGDRFHDLVANHRRQSFKRLVQQKNGSVPEQRSCQ